MASDDQLKAELTGLLGVAENSDAAADALAFLFPKLAGKVGKPVATEDIGNRAVERRISKAEFSGNYFSLTPDRLHPSKQQLEGLFAAGPSSFFGRLAGLVQAADDNEKLEIINVWLDFLEGALPRPGNDHRSWFLSLVEFIGRLSIKRDWQSEPMFGLSYEDRIEFALVGMLRRLDAELRAEAMEYAIAEATDISILCSLFRHIAGDVEPTGASEKVDFFESDIAKSLREKLLGRIRELANSGGLLLQRRPANILWFWWGCAFGAEVRAYTGREMGRMDGLRNLFVIPITVVHSTGGNYEHIDRRSWSKIVDLDELARRADLITKQSEDPARADAQRFLEALDRGRDEF